MTNQRKYLTVIEASAFYDWSIGGLRGLLHRRKENGLNTAILKIGKKILIDKEAFEVWLMSHRERKE